MKKVITAEQAAQLGQAQIYAGETLLIAAKRAAASDCDVVINTITGGSYRLIQITMRKSRLFQVKNQRSTKKFKLTALGVNYVLHHWGTNKGVIHEYS